VSIRWPEDERSVVTFGRLYLNSLSPTRSFPPHARGAGSISRCVGVLRRLRVNAASRFVMAASRCRKSTGQRDSGSAIVE
jgi:hypothetical protein